MQLAVPSPDALTDEFFKEVRRGLQVQDSFSQLREEASARLAQIAKEQKDSVMGKIVGYVPQQEYIELAQKYGSECWDDRGFVRDFFKNEPGMKVSNI